MEALGSGVEQLALSDSRPDGPRSKKDGSEDQKDAEASSVRQSLEMPSAREVSLAQRIAELERRNSEYEARISAGDLVSHGKAGMFSVPHNLIPVLAQLKTHIASLTAENKAMSHLLYAKPSQDVWPENTLDMRLVLERVKKLMRENEEFEEMVLEAGKVGGNELEAVLNETKLTILSLEDELAKQAEGANTLAAELAAYKARFGPLTAQQPAARTNTRGQGGRAPDRSRQDRRKPKA